MVDRLSLNTESNIGRINCIFLIKIYEKIVYHILIHSTFEHFTITNLQFQDPCHDVTQQHGGTKYVTGSSCGYRCVLILSFHIYFAHKQIYN